MENLDTTFERQKKKSPIRYRASRISDGPRVHRLVKEGDGLELNTCYAYLLLCDHFSDTTLVAERDGELVGFVGAYRPPEREDTVFVWQIGIDASARGRGIASGLLDALVAAPGCEGVTFLEATVTPDNEPSRRLFESFAKRHAASFTWSHGYHEDLFPQNHAPEQLIRIGPFK
jgi:L-2,4-diaminobutyric acid acetyltransferase